MFPEYLITCYKFICILFLLFIFEKNEILLEIISLWLYYEVDSNFCIDLLQYQSAEIKNLSQYILLWAFKFV